MDFLLGLMFGSILQSSRDREVARPPEYARPTYMEVNRVDRVSDLRADVYLKTKRRSIFGKKFGESVVSFHFAYLPEGAIISTKLEGQSVIAEAFICGTLYSQLVHA